METLNETICFKEIEFKRLGSFVRLGFGDDPDLMNKYQQLNTDFETTVARNVKNVEDARKVYDLKCYAVLKDHFSIGFTVMDEKNGLLFSFGIMRPYRTKEVVIAWFNEIVGMLGDTFVCVLWNQNQRAIDFLKKNGMKVIMKTETETTLLYDK